MAKEWLYFNSRDELLRVDVSKIMCFEADGNYTNILMTNNMRASVCMNLAAMEKMLHALPEKMREHYADIMYETGEEDQVLHRYVKAADKISALIKCIEETEGDRCQTANLTVSAFA